MRDNRGRFVKGSKQKPPSRLGIKHTMEARLKISQGLKGKYVGENHCGWKADNVKYQGLHIWVRKNLGKAVRCEQCKGSKGSVRFEWANISHEYKRELSDWMQLCRKCHHQYDGISQKIHKTQIFI